MKLPLYSAAAALLAAAVPFSAQALVLTGTSSSYGEYVNLTFTVGGVVTPVTTTSGPQPTAGGTAPSPYSSNTSSLSLNLPIGGVGGTLGTGVLQVTAQSNVDGTAGSRSASATATANNLALALVGGSFTADAIATTANVSGDSGSLVATGNTTFSNAVLTTGLGVAPVNPSLAPNTSLFGTTGLSVIGNEQILGGNGTTSRTLEVNGLHISFTNYSFGGGTLDGDIILAHSQASLIAAVPEPATYSMFGAGIAGLLLALRRRRQGTDAA